jgi:hypothetical protein
VICLKKEKSLNTFISFPFTSLFYIKIQTFFNCNFSLSKTLYCVRIKMSIVKGKTFCIQKKNTHFKVNSESKMFKMYKN